MAVPSAICISLCCMCVECMQKQQFNQDIWRFWSCNPSNWFPHLSEQLEKCICVICFILIGDDIAIVNTIMIFKNDNTNECFSSQWGYRNKKIGPLACEKNVLTMEGQIKQGQDYRTHFHVCKKYVLQIMKYYSNL